MKAFDDLEAYYSADEIWERLDEIRDEYAAEYEKLCLSMLKKEYLKL